MNDSGDSGPVVPSTKPISRRWKKVRLKLAYAAISVCLTVLAMLLFVAAIWINGGRGLGWIVELGLLQPMFAALLALVVVMGVWVAKGSYVGERRKGVRSASSSTIAVRLWALCFALLLGAMLLSATLSSLQRNHMAWPGPSRPGAKIEITSQATKTGNSSSIKVTQ